MKRSFHHTFLDVEKCGTIDERARLKCKKQHYNSAPNIWPLPMEMFLPFTRPARRRWRNKKKRNPIKFHFDAERDYICISKSFHSTTDSSLISHIQPCRSKSISGSRNATSRFCHHIKRTALRKPKCMVWMVRFNACNCLQQALGGSSGALFAAGSALKSLTLCCISLLLYTYMNGNCLACL